MTTAEIIILWFAWSAGAVVMGRDWHDHRSTRGPDLGGNITMAFIFLPFAILPWFFNKLLEEYDRSKELAEMRSQELEEKIEELDDALDELEE